MTPDRWTGGGWHDDTVTVTSATVDLYVLNPDGSVRSVGQGNYVRHTWVEYEDGLYKCVLILENPIPSYELQAQESFSHFLVDIIGTDTVYTVTDERNVGTMYFYFGTDDQETNTKIVW